MKGESEGRETDGDDDITDGVADSNRSRFSVTTAISSLLDATLIVEIDEFWLSCDCGRG